MIAILITIMVLELKVPRGGDLEALKPVLPVFVTYVLSFLYLETYWNNHHSQGPQSRRPGRSGVDNP